MIKVMVSRRAANVWWGLIVLIIANAFFSTNSTFGWVIGGALVLGALFLFVKAATNR
jgi:hypothetical protein